MIVIERGSFMKKVSILAIIILLLVACQSSKEDKPNGAATENNQSTEEMDNINEAEKDVQEKNETTSDTRIEDEQTDQEKKVNEEPSEENKPLAKEETVPTAEQENDLNEVQVTKELKELSYKIFEAQENADYYYLQRILAEGATIDETNNLFIFAQVDFPHEQEFLTGIENTLEYRYINLDNPDSIIVGFASVREEFSFTIDLEYVNVNGNWKLNDMDINK